LNRTAAMAKVLTRRPHRRAAADGEVPAVREATPEEGWALFDRVARDELGIDGEEFIRRWFGGHYAADPDQPGVIEVEMLLPFAWDRVQEHLRTHENQSGAKYPT
jgi:hypothetical protein